MAYSAGVPRPKTATSGRASISAPIRVAEAVAEEGGWGGEAGGVDASAIRRKRIGHAREMVEAIGGAAEGEGAAMITMFIVTAMVSVAEAAVERTAGARGGCVAAPIAGPWLPRDPPEFQAEALEDRAGGAGEEMAGG